MDLGVDTDQTAYEQDVKFSQLNRIFDAQQGMLFNHLMLIFALQTQLWLRSKVSIETPSMGSKQL